jgi:hypothetical protein
MQFISKVHFVGAFAKLQNATFSFVMSVRPSTWNDSGPTALIFMKIDIRVLFPKIHRKNSSFIKTEQERALYMKMDVHFLIISRSVLLRMINISDKICTKNQITHFMFNNFFRKSCRLWDNAEKYCRAEQAADDNMANTHCMQGTQL